MRIALPDDAPVWLLELMADKTIARASEALWNKVIAHETRIDAQYCRELELSLPIELDRDQQIALVRQFVAEEFTAKGIIADWVVHAPDGNPHVHLMHTIRLITPGGFGPKRIAILGNDGQPQRLNGKIVYRSFVGGPAELRALRLAWGAVVNQHLGLAGFDHRIDMRSYADQGVAITPSTHIGPKPNAMAKVRGDVDRLHEHAGSRAQAVADLIADPAQLLVKISRERSTFTAHDIARDLGRMIDEPRVFNEVLARVMGHPNLVPLRGDVRDPQTRKIIALAVYSTRELVQTEHDMAVAVEALARKSGFTVPPARVDAAIAAVVLYDPSRPFTLDAEQADAVRHVTGASAIAAVVGYAGAGKSTMLGAANRAWRANGRRVFGAALAGKAAAGLEASAGIPSRTLHAWENAWSKDRDRLAAGDVFVIDEAGMVGSQQMARIVAAVAQADAKLVLVGDARQLQPIEAGAAFRTITDRIGFVELVGIRRQRETWAQDASRRFGRGEAAEALEAYRAREHIETPEDRQAAREAIVADWTAARALVADGTPPRGDALLVLAHTNADVFALNTSLRAVMLAQGGLTEPYLIETERGPREFAVGDRIIFLKNERFTEPAAPELGRQSVKNGMVGTVAATANGVLRVALDGGGTVAFRASTYRNIDHGYAATIHKNQGATVDRAFVLATPMMDQHLTYVAMSRHRERATLYAAKSDFPSIESLTATLGRARAKTTTLDFTGGDRTAVAAFAARRSIDTIADIAPAFAAYVERQTAWMASARVGLEALWQRAGIAMGAVRGRGVAARDPAPVAAQPAQPMVPAGSPPLRPARVMPDVTPSPMIVALRTDTAGQKAKADVEGLAIAAYGSVAPIAHILAAVPAEPRQVTEWASAQALLHRGAVDAPLVGNVGWFSGKPDRERQAAIAAEQALVRKIGAYASRLEQVERDLKERHLERRMRLAVEIPAPSRELAVALQKSPAEAVSVFEASPPLAKEFATLQHALWAGLSRDERAAVAAGNAAAAAPRLGVSEDQAKALSTVLIAADGIGKAQRIIADEQRRIELAQDQAQARSQGPGFSR